MISFAETFGISGMAISTRQKKFIARMKEDSKGPNIHGGIRESRVSAASGEFETVADAEELNYFGGTVPLSAGVNPLWIRDHEIEFHKNNAGLLNAQSGLGTCEHFSDTPFHFAYDEFARGREVLLGRIPEGSTIVCRIVRRSGFLTPESFTLCSDSNLQMCFAYSEPLRSRGSYISVYSDRGKSARSYLGKIRSNQWGSEYFFKDADDRSTPALRLEYESRLTSSSDDLGPCRRMTATISPRTREVIPKNCESFDIFSETTFTSLRLTSLEPARTSQGYTLDFETPPTLNIIPSVKNFVLVNVTGHKVLCMYKVGKDEYELKILGGYMSLLHAFVIGVSSIDKKLCTQ